MTTATSLSVTKTRCSRRVLQVPDLVLQRLWEWMRYVSKRKGGLEVLVPEVFDGVTAVMNAASEQLVAGTYAPKQSRERVLAQLRQLDPLLRDDGESV